MQVPDMSRFAYITLLMKGDFYVSGALVLASSLKRTGNRADVICMVTEDVSPTACSVLSDSKLFDHVFKVDYINITPRQSFESKKIQELYKDITPIILTKFQCLLFEQYEKVCLLDADIVVLRSMDAVFEVETPAGNFYKHHGFYPSDMRTGDIVPRDSIRRAIRETVGVFGSPILLPTGKDIHRQFKDYIAQLPTNKAVTKSKMKFGLDELLITMFFNSIRKEEWRYIGTNYNTIPWKDKQEDPRLYHYVHQKPWTMQENAWPDLKPWFDEAHHIYDNYPQTRQFFKCLGKSDRSDIEEAEISEALYRMETKSYEYHARVKAILEDW
jgi:alpha-N-acetylglucosamine transferase